MDQYYISGHAAEPQLFHLLANISHSHPNLKPVCLLYEQFCIKSEVPVGLSCKNVCGEI